MAEDEDALWTTEDVATYTSLPMGTLRQWRHRGVGPRSFRVGGRVRYRRADVLAFVAECQATEDQRLQERRQAVSTAPGGQARPPRRTARSVTKQGARNRSGA